MEPGVQSKNWATANDPKPPAYTSFGRASVKEAGVEAIFATAQTSKLTDYMRDKKEDGYARNKREPLGTAPIMLAKPPAFTEAPDFKFGVKSEDPQSLAEVMMPDGKFHAHRKTASTREEEVEVTRPACRNYNWEGAGIDPVHHSFGKSVKQPGVGGMSGVQLAFAEGNATATQTSIGLKRVEDLKTSKRDVVGRNKHFALQEAAFQSGISFGASKVQADEFGVKEAIGGFYSKEEQMPDPKLGKVIVRRGMELPDSLDLAKTVFGQPSIRTDKKPPALRSVADNINYGDEQASGQVLFPPKFAFEGISPSDFTRERERDEVRSIFAAIGMTATDAEFVKICAQATRHGVLCYNSYREAYNKLKLGI